MANIMCSKRCHMCIDGCIHYKIREIPGTRHDYGMYSITDPPIQIHTCELYPEKYHDWMETYGQVSPKILTEEEFKVFDACYEPNENIQHLDELIDIANQILDKLNGTGKSGNI